MAMLLRMILTTLAILLVTNVYSGIQVDSVTTAIIAAVVLALINTIVRPVIVLLTLPISMLTLGLFLLVINAAMLYLAAWLVNGFDVGGYWDALIASLIISVVVALLNGLIKSKS
ncbi:MAG: phage holin family protein [Gemmatimonadetes bacterium]|nr:phage holin family protein [Gemmatimonadota bacterium]MYA78600.1 phage holin family protein [Gemmatimonadota bacterium]MYG17359.1 phage holin family protein [Gemmatimonadota bacterium]MYH17577.1 phage holin family protein [Gemmatimonadota bacterium]MYL00096.1 phage holin family protein [Gemmatimonadota bacterium]